MTQVEVSLPNNHHQGSVEKGGDGGVELKNEKETSSDLINSMLPKELILRIFSFLDIVSLCRCAQVCKYWNKLALDPDNWRNITLFSLRHKVRGVVIENLALRYGSYIRRINLRGCKAVTDMSMLTVFRYCRLLEELSLDDCNQLTDNTCTSLSFFCPLIVHLNLASCNVSNLSLEAIGQNCPNLKLIDISNCNRITPKGIESLVKKCKNLLSFISVACGPNTINDEALAVIGEHCHQLKLINLNGCFAVTDQGVKCLAEGCPRLVNCCLSKCHTITDQSLISLGQFCHHLRTLGLNDCQHVTDNGFQVLAQNCNLLENLDLEDCALITDQTLYHLTSNCPNLKRLALSHCDKITDEGIKYIGKNVNVSESIQYLELDNCTLLTDAAIDHLLSCKHLKRLDIYDNSRISHQATKKLYTFLPQMDIRTCIQSTSANEQAVTEARHRYYRCCAIL